MIFTDLNQNSVNHAGIFSGNLFAPQELIFKSFNNAYISRNYFMVPVTGCMLAFSLDHSVSFPIDLAHSAAVQNSGIYT